ncbi:MAG: glycosyltransferase [Chlorobium sp.]|nr:glycosyltransferase [Chlorobium sp.]
MKRLKVAVVYPYWPLYREPIARLLCQQATPNPEYVLISCRESKDSIKTIDPEKANITVEQGGLRWRFVENFWLGKFFLWQTGIVRLGFSREFDVIIYLGQYSHLSTLVSAVLARMTGKRVLMWTHGFINENQNVKELIRSFFYRLAHGFLLYGNRAKKIMISKGFDPNSLYVIYNSLDYDRQKMIRDTISDDAPDDYKREIFDHNNLPVLLFIGRLTPQKKLSMLIDAGKNLLDAGHPVNILFIGDGPERTRLEKLSSKFQMSEYVHFFGECHDELELAKLIMMSDICVAPGEVGLTAMHCLAYGTPVITHDDFSKQMPEYEAIEDGISGTFFRHGDPADLALKIKGWLSSGKLKVDVRSRCVGVIEKYYNPRYQLGIINNAVLGNAAEM